MTNKVPTPPTTSHDCPTWCTRDHTGEPRDDELFTHSRDVDLIPIKTGAIAVDVYQHHASEIVGQVFLTVNRQDTFNVPSATARRIGRALLAAADAIDGDVQAQLAEAGIEADWSGDGFFLRFDRSTPLTTDQLEQVLAAAQTATEGVLAEISMRRRLL